MKTFEQYYNEKMLEEGKLGKALATGALAAGLMTSQAQGAIYNFFNSINTIFTTICS